MACPAVGRVSEQPFARVFGSLSARRFTGALKMTQDGRPWSVWWREGVLVDAESSSPEDTLGRVALEAGLVDTTTVALSIQRMAQFPGKKQLDALVEIGGLKGDTATRAARMALCRRAVRVFALSN